MYVHRCDIQVISTMQFPQVLRKLTHHDTVTRSNILPICYV